MNIHFLGGAMEIGGSCIYVRTGGKGILLDCGIRQSGTKDPLPDFRVIQEQGGLDAIIVSHAHMDHIGTLPVISRAYPKAKIYMTAMTADLTRVLLYDSLKLMDYKEDEIPHYTEQDVLFMLNRVVPLRFQTETAILEKTMLTFYQAGHIAGAACIYLVTEEGALFYSGDFAAFSQRTIEGVRIPKLRPDVAIVETTYGTLLHANRQSQERRLVELVRECVEKKQKVLIPAFALGRAQEVLLILRAAIQNKEIPAVPVYVDGMVRDINTMYTRNPTFLKNALGKRILKGNEPFYTKEIQAVEPKQKREELLMGKEPAIIVSSSGMLTGGPSALYASKLVSLENACIIITGYQDEESPGRQLLNLLSGAKEGQADSRKLTLNGISYPVRCRIEQVGLSAHGDKAEIMGLLERLSARRIFLVHGNREVIRELGSELSEEDYRRQVFLPECGQGYDVVIHSRRKQLIFTPEFTMQKTEPLSEENEKLLFNYWQEHYPGKRFSVAQIAFIWYGKRTEDETILKEMQERLMKSPYFSPNEKQLFLFEVNPAETVAQNLAPKELTPQELELYVKKLFDGYACRKMSYHMDRREILLQFDYPDSLDHQGFQKKALQFQELTGWSIGISTSMNHNAAGSFVHTLLPGRVSKLSYYVDRRCYAVTVPELLNTDREAARTFRDTTGWNLLINGQDVLAEEGSGGQGKPSGSRERSSAAAEDMMVFWPSNRAREMLEQNLAFSCADQEFEPVPEAVEKKSLKQDADGKYLEFSFISPAVGLRCRETLQRIADQTGWRIRIADKVNQNGLLQTARLLCMEYDILPVKNPSYLPEKRMVQMKVSQAAEPEVISKIEEEFREKTGCGCEIVVV